MAYMIDLMELQRKSEECVNFNSGEPKTIFAMTLRFKKKKKKNELDKKNSEHLCNRHFI